MAQPVDYHSVQTSGKTLDEDAGDGLFESIEQHAQKVYLPAGRILLSQGSACQAVFRLEEGLVKLLHRRSGGEEVVVGLRSSGWLIGTAAALLRRPHQATAVAVTECTVTMVEVRRFVNHLSHNSDALLALLRAQSHESYVQVERLALLTCVPARRRLEILLGDLVRMLGTRATGGEVRFRMPLVQQELAQAIKVTPETVCRLLADLERDGVIRRTSGQMKILRPADLEDLAE